MLTDEEKQKIYEEEKARLEAREELERKASSLNAAASPTATPVAAIRKGSGMGVASLILGILSFLPFSVLTGIPAIITGHVAVAQNRQGKGLAISGLILGWLSVIALVVVAAVMLVKKPSATGGAATSTSAPTSYAPELEVISFSWGGTETGHFAEAKGQVKNISGRRLENVEAVVTFNDKRGGFITSSDALIDYNPILPGQTSPFSVIETYNPAMRTGTAVVEFKFLMGGTIPTRQSEK